MKKKKSLTVLFIFLFAVRLFALDGTAGRGDDGSPFSLHPALDGILLTASAGLNGMVLYFDQVKKVNHLEFDGNNLDPSRINAFDQWLTFPYSPVIDKLGTGLAIASILTPAILFSTPSNQWLTIGTMYIETLTLAYGLKELGKLCISRARPYMYFDDFPSEALEDYDWNRSFPSGHTTLAFAGASFTSFVFTKYYPDSKWKIPVIASSYAIAVGTAVCRIASGEHFTTDVVVGALTGALCGLFVPWIHTLDFGIKDNSSSISLQVAPTRATLSIKF